MTTTNTENRGADLATIRAIAEAVPDPELVVVNVGDLGIIREVRAGENGFEIDVTPTYSACPATLAIELAIETAVSAQGHPVRVRRVLSPAWTTDWISSEGRAKLKASGIAPLRYAARRMIVLAAMMPGISTVPRWLARIVIA